jgi:hypothetical protein
MDQTAMMRPEGSFFMNIRREAYSARDVDPALGKSQFSGMGRKERRRASEP